MQLKKNKGGTNPKDQRGRNDMGRKLKNPFSTEWWCRNSNTTRGRKREKETKKRERKRGGDNYRNKK